jgi:signal peptidase
LDRTTRVNIDQALPVAKPATVSYDNKVKININKISERALLIVVILLIVISAFVYTAPRFGLSVDNIGSGSMSPTLNVGTMILTGAMDPDQLKVRDIIVFRQDSADKPMICHRIFAINSYPLSFTTKGDAFTTADKFTVPAANVVGRVNYSVPLVGNFVAFLKTQIGLLVCLIVPAVIIIGMCFRALWQEIIKIKNNNIAKAAKP